jgi:hypothetical protein
VIDLLSHANPPGINPGGFFLCPGHAHLAVDCAFRLRQAVSGWKDRPVAGYLTEQEFSRTFNSLMCIALQAALSWALS